MNNDNALPKTGYLAFDALSMKAFLKQRLIDNGVFTDQIYEGSNLAQIIDVFAMTFQNLIFYMNKTGAEGIFTDAQIYENLNRITKALGYNPVGHQTALLPFSLKCGNLEERYTYIIPRYSHVTIGNSSFSLSDDIVFVPSIVDSEGYLDGISVPKLLYQGKYKEFKQYTAVGDDYELIELNPGTNILIDHFNIDVYVKTQSDGKWHEAERTQSLYLNDAADLVYECRLNENGYYEIKFGNDICGKKLKEGDLVQIYYLQSDGPGVSIGAGQANNRNFTPYQSDTFSEIMADINTTSMQEITNANSGFVEIFNKTASTYFSPAETSDGIRANAPSNFRAQYRLVTANDFKSFVATNYSNVVHSTYIMNNWEYINTYLKYLHSVGLKKPSSDTRMAMGQFMFADSCNFNNVYIFATPKISPGNKGYSYLPNELKAMIIQDMNKYKTLTCEPVVVDPVYVGFRIGLPKNGESPKYTDGDVTKLVITKTPNSHKSSNTIAEEIADAIKSFFSIQNNSLGQPVKINTLAQTIASINGVQSFKTVRTDSSGKTQQVSGLSMVLFNEAYPEICDTVSSDFPMEGFMFPYYYDINGIRDHIQVVGDETSYNAIEY